MTQKELKRIEIVHQVEEKKIKRGKAAELLSVSVRQIKRLVKAHREKGDAGLIHGLRGKQGNRAIDEDTKEKAVKLFKERYSDFGPTLAAEYLRDEDKLDIKGPTLRLVLIDEGLWEVKSRKQGHKAWRERKDCFGEMVQFDGSHHDWFEGRGEKCVLLAGIDDTTGKILAIFFPAEDTRSVFLFWREYFELFGKPHSIYLDRGSVYKVNAPKALDEKVLTQFERAMEDDLGIGVIHARSPQAKGRVERLFETLQDRLVKALRLKGISDPETANTFLRSEFLLKFNKQFAKVPKSSINLHTPLKSSDNLEAALSIQSNRFINNDFTVRFDNHWYQLGSTQPALVTPKMKVTIEKRLDQTIHIRLKSKYLVFKETDKPVKEKKQPTAWALTSNTSNHYPQMARVPAKDNPWRRFKPTKALTKS